MKANKYRWVPDKIMRDILISVDCIEYCEENNIKNG